MTTSAPACIGGDGVDDRGGGISSGGGGSLASLWLCTRLETLILDNNLLTLLPPAVSRLRRLRCLSVARNRLRCVPPAVATLPLLTTLDVSHNRIESIESIGGTGCIASIDADGNGDSGGNGSGNVSMLPSLASAASLRYLYLKGNPCHAKMRTAMAKAALQTKKGKRATHTSLSSFLATTCSGGDSDVGGGGSGGGGGGNSDDVSGGGGTTVDVGVVDARFFTPAALLVRAAWSTLRACERTSYLELCGLPKQRLPDEIACVLHCNGIESIESIESIDQSDGTAGVAANVKRLFLTSQVRSITLASVNYYLPCLAFAVNHACF
jgi:hypothetical protein